MSPSGSGSVCSLAAPCGTFNAGVSKLFPGDTLYLRGGTYNGHASGNSASYWANMGGRSGTASAPITVRNYPGETPVLDGQCTTSGTAQRGAYDLWTPNRCTGNGNGEAFIFNGESYIVLDGLRIQHYNNSSGNGTITPVNNAHHLTFQNLTMVDNGANANDHHIYPGASGVNNLLIRRNRFIRAFGGGIHMWHYPNATQVRNREQPVRQQPLGHPRRRRVAVGDRQQHVLRGHGAAVLQPAVGERADRHGLANPRRCSCATTCRTP
jgi:hypothetical protein